MSADALMVENRSRRRGHTFGGCPGCTRVLSTARSCTSRSQGTVPLAAIIGRVSSSVAAMHPGGLESVSPVGPGPGRSFPGVVSGFIVCSRCARVIAGAVAWLGCSGPGDSPNPLSLSSAGGHVTVRRRSRHASRIIPYMSASHIVVSSHRYRCPSSLYKFVVRSIHQKPRLTSAGPPASSSGVGSYLAENCH